MAKIFPLTDLLTGLKFQIRGSSMTPLWRQEFSSTAGGVVLVKDLGPLLWRVSYLTTPMSREAAHALEADLLSLNNGSQLFVGYDPSKPFPTSDRVSALTGLTVAALSANRLSLSVTGLPANFKVTKGDWISIDDGINLHLVQAVENKTASAGGVSGMFEVRPGLRPSIIAGNTVRMRHAPARFMVDAGSVEKNTLGGRRDTLAWTGTQVIL